MTAIAQGKYIGTLIGDQPTSEADHFYRCKVCGGWVDYRNLGKVFAHEGPLPHPERNDRTSRSRCANAAAKTNPRAGRHKYLGSAPPPHRQRHGQGDRRAFRWRKLLETGVYATVEEIAAAEKINSSYVSRVLRLTLLAPTIVEAVLDGRQPAEMTTRLEPLAPFPLASPARFSRSIQEPD